MKILVIGGAGYIGSHVVREFLDSGHSVSVFDNLSSGRRQNLFPEASFIEGDILVPQELLCAMEKGFDAVVHLAAFKAAGESMLSPEKYALNNINGTVNILNAACTAGIKRIVFSSTAAVYGEPDYMPVDEEHPLRPENFYGFTKLEIERLLVWYERLKGLRFAALRYFNAAGYDPAGRIYGLEKNPANLLPVVMETACGKRPFVNVFGNDYDTPDGTGVRDYVHVSDLARGHVMALDWICANDKSLTVNLGSGYGLSVLDLVESARRVSGQPVPIKITERRQGDPAKLFSSAQKARDLLGWEARYSDVDSLVGTTWKAYQRSFSSGETDAGTKH
jgi:UDP-glucose 4-epimerase